MGLIFILIYLLIKVNVFNCFVLVDRVSRTITLSWISINYLLYCSDIYQGGHINHMVYLGCPLYNRRGRSISIHKVYHFYSLVNQEWEQLLASTGRRLFCSKTELSHAGYQIVTSRYYCYLLCCFTDLSTLWVSNKTQICVYHGAVDRMEVSASVSRGYLTEAVVPPSLETARLLKNRSFKEETGL